MLNGENHDKVLNMEKRYFIEDVEKELCITRRTYYNWEKAGRCRRQNAIP